MFINPEDAVGNYNQVVVYANPDAPAGEKVQAVDEATGEILYKAVPCTQAEKDKVQRWIDEAPARDMTRIREHRNSLLTETDWMANSDVTMSDEWKTYRQELRDIPASNTVYEDVTWPPKPE